MTRLTRFSAPALLAAAAMAATPAAAAELPVATTQTAAPLWGGYDSEADTASQYRYYYGDRYYRGYPRYRYRNRTSVGDVIAGVAIIGAVAAVVNAATKNRDDRRYRDRDYRYRDSRYRDTDARGIDSAVDLCVREIERDARVASVDSVDRSGAGWQVTGAMYDGAAFTCSIGADGRIDDISIGGTARPYGASADDQQWSDDRYYQARMDAGQVAYEPQQTATATADAQPAYPGGPLPGEVFEDEEPASGG